MLMKGMRGLIVGVANKRSIAWAIARACADNGAQLALTYQNERLGENVKELAEELENPLVLPLDVSDDAQIKAAFEAIGEQWGKLDFMVHAVAYAPRQALEGDFISTSREDFRIAQDISVYSLAALAQGAKPLMTEGGSIITLSYLGGSRVMTNYNVMGVAKAALESSVRYLAADLGPPWNPCERAFRGASQDAGQQWHRKLLHHSGAPQETCAASETGGTRRSGRRRAVPAKPHGSRGHGPDNLY